ncbi:three-Cys-motif partner protein TcmP [Sphingobacterium athyrii]|uniref:Three-Cys-motif partner protein TcmP n=1 Tax=Sphingobacterium athyrii TaxID=2152717 RepID=A0A363NWI8_9SPHI|nr:three-Cys-motif partner protein TcmP [Sphingobacterium athyrii]PUV25149.1 hypothetical protein DCO56_09425 [Sphingobacterium athyrii]
MKKKSQNNLFVHSAVKIDLLGKYLSKYFSIMSNTPYVDIVHYYDLFSGPGIYDNGGEGSPMVVLGKLKEVYSRGKERNADLSTYRCNFNDIDPRLIEKLKNNIEAANIHCAEIGSIAFSSIDYKILCGELRDTLKKMPKNEKAFVFIDPYGYKEVRFSEIKDLLTGKNSEVLLFLPTHFMFRFNENGTPESLHNFIDDIVPKEQWPKSETGLDFVENLKEAFQKNLGSDYFVDSFIISREKNQFFCLFFFTSHIYGFDRMLDTKWQIDEEDGRGWKFNSNSIDLFSGVTNGPNISKYEKILKVFLKEKRSNKDLYQFSLHNGYLPSHTGQILKKCQDDGNLIATLPDGSRARKSSFYISWDNYKNNQSEKAFFRLK